MSARDGARGGSGLAAGILGGGVFLLLELILDSGFLFAAAAGAAAFAAGLLMAGKGKADGGEGVPSGEELSRVLGEAESRLARIDGAARESGAETRAILARGVRAARGIIADVRKSPRDFPMTRPFLESHLDSAARIAEAHAALLSRGTENEEARDALSRSSRALASFALAYEALRSRLLEADARELQSEIDALESSLEAEGLTDEKP